MATTVCQPSQKFCTSDDKGLPTGHAAALLDDVCYVVGGGNNIEGCTDCIALDLKDAPDADLVWVFVTEVPRHGALASEGLSVQVLPSQHALLGWGGYNGQYHNRLHCFQPGVPIA